VNVIGKLSSCVPETFLEVSRVYNLITGKLSSCVPKKKISIPEILCGVKSKIKRVKLELFIFWRGGRKFFLNQSIKHAKASL
jgi:hypothetical protein